MNNTNSVVTELIDIAFNGEQWTALVGYRRKGDDLGHLVGATRGYCVLHFDFEEEARGMLPGVEIEV